MEYPMRVYGYNIFEVFLTRILGILAWLIITYSIITLFPQLPFHTINYLGGILSAALFFSGIMMGIASSGIRQNRSIIDAALFYSFLSSLGWIAAGIYSSKLDYIITGVVLMLFLAEIYFIRKQAIQARFKPRFFTLREFETMIQIADTMIDADGKAVLNPINVAISVDHMFSKVNSPAVKEIKLVMLLVEWILPMIDFRPFPFSTLGTNERRMLVEKVIKSKGLFRNVAKVLKLLTCVGYYGDPKGMAQVGYIPFEQREHSEPGGHFLDPKYYDDPFPRKENNE